MYFFFPILVGRPPGSGRKKHLLPPPPYPRQKHRSIPTSPLSYLPIPSLPPWFMHRPRHGPRHNRKHNYDPCKSHFIMLRSVILRSYLKTFGDWLSITVTPNNMLPLEKI